MYHYAGNNPVKYVDPDGRDDFSFEDFFRNQSEAFFLDVSAGCNDFAGKIKNFFLNIGSGNFKIDAGTAIIHKGVEIKSYYINGSSSYDMNDIDEAFQCFMGAPITVSEKGVSITYSKDIIPDIFAGGGTLSVRKPDMSKDAVRLGGTFFVDAKLVGVSANLGISAPVNNIENDFFIRAKSNSVRAENLKDPMRCF